MSIQLALLSMLATSTWKMLWFEISKMLIAVLKNKFIVLFIIIFGTLLFLIMTMLLLSMVNARVAVSDSSQSGVLSVAAPDHHDFSPRSDRESIAVRLAAVA